MKKSTKLIIYAFILVVVILLFKQTNIPTTWSALVYEEKPLQGKKELLKQLQQQYALFLLDVEQEIIVDSVHPKESRHIALRAKGHMQIGIDTRLLNETDIYTNKDSIAIQLPPAELLDSEIDPSGFITLQQTGQWSEQEILRLKANAKKVMEEEALTGKLTQRAELRGRSILDQFLQTAGFKKITIL